MLAPMSSDLDRPAPEPATVAVTGSASRWVPADFADVSFTVARQAATTGQAVAEAGEAYAALDAALGAHGAVIVRRTTTSLSVREVVRYERESGLAVREGFAASRTQSVRFLARSEAGDALRAALAAVPELIVGGPAFELDPANPVHALVRADAAVAARASAEAYAGGLGLALDRVLRLWEPDRSDGAGYGGGGPRVMAKMLSAEPEGGDSVLVDLGPEDVEVTAEVELTVALVEPS